MLVDELVFQCSCWCSGWRVYETTDQAFDTVLAECDNEELLIGALSNNDPVGQSRF